MSGKQDPKSCACGCGGLTKAGQFLAGHDRKLEAACCNAVGGVIELKHLLESLGYKIEVKA